MITCENYFFLIKTRHKLWTFLYTSTGSNNGQITSLWLVSIGTKIIVIIVWFKKPLLKLPSENYEMKNR